jgi:hypothetical protein
VRSEPPAVEAARAKMRQHLLWQLPLFIGLTGEPPVIRTDFKSTASADWATSPDRPEAYQLGWRALTLALQARHCHRAVPGLLMRY